MEPYTSDEFPDYSVPWLQRWREEDFSWPALGKRENWLQGHGGTLQDYFRRVENNATDDEMLARGSLVDCGPEGLYHVLFVPQEWTTGGTVALTTSELLERQRQHWSVLESKGGIRDTFSGTLVGVQPPPELAQRLVSSFRSSFSWVRFPLALRNIPRRGDRCFTHCAFDQEVIFYGRTNTEGGQSTVHFTWCDFGKRIVVEQVSDLHLLDINGSALRERMDVSDSDLQKIRVDGCEVAAISMTDTTVQGPITIGTSTVGWIEWMNCTFEAHVLLVDAAIEKSLGWLACDFKNRVTLASMIWPTSVESCATASGSKFDGIVEIEDGDPPPVQLFQEAEFRSKISLSWFSDKQKKESFETELNALRNLSGDAAKQKHAQSVESGCRTLRKVAEAAGDVHSEHFWHRSELIARKARGESAPSETTFSYLYGLLADYGLSIGRPFTVLLLSTILFGFFYGWVGGSSWSGRLNVAGLEEGLGYSLSRTIPLGVFGDETNHWRQQLLGSAGEISHIWIRAVATAQSVFSAVLIYLGVMAIRRKFRIS